MSLIKIDGVSYNVGAVDLRRNGEIIYDNLTRGTALDFSEIADAVGTRYSYSLSIESRPSPQIADASENGYDAFYYDITTPKSRRFVELPFGQSTISFWANIRTVNDILHKSYDGNKWGRLSVTALR